MSFIVKEGGKKSSCIFTIGPVGHLVLFFLSERKSWNQPTEIYLPVKQEDCLYVVWIAVCSLVWMASRSPNFTPQRCRSRSRRTQGVGWVAVGVVGLQKGRVPSSQCGCNVEKQRFSERRCNPHLRVFLPPCLITVQYPLNKYFRSCLFCVCVCVCICVLVGANGLNWELSSIP